jgi:hypothetical protein
MVMREHARSLLMGPGGELRAAFSPHDDATRLGALFARAGLFAGDGGSASATCGERP